MTKSFVFTFTAKPGVELHPGAYPAVTTKPIEADTIEAALASAEFMYPEAIDVDAYNMTFTSSDS